MTSVYSYDTLIQGTLSVLGKATATTPAKTDNTTTIATTAYVKSQGYYVPGSYLNITDYTGLGSTSVNSYIVNTTYLSNPRNQGGGAWCGGVNGFIASTDAGFPLSLGTANCSLLCTAAVIAGGFACTSDKRIKTNIKDVEGEDCLMFLRKIQPKLYNYVDMLKNGSGSKFGFIAQEMESIFPSCVNTYVDFIPNIFELHFLSCHFLKQSYKMKRCFLK